MKQLLIITNNPAVVEKYQHCHLEVKETAWDVLIRVRDLVHLGHQLLSHPLAGSVKPNETPYRSVIISAKAERFDYRSLQGIEGALRKYEQFQKNKPTPEWSERILKDFQLIDVTLLDSGYESLS